MEIRKVTEANEKIDEFIGESFVIYANKNGIDLKYEEFCFVAEEEGQILGVITGKAYYNEVNIGDLIVDENHRGKDIGTKLVRHVEDSYKNKGFTKATLTTFGFQAPNFYPKLGYQLEFVREDPDPKLSKYFFSKPI